MNGWRWPLLWLAVLWLALLAMSAGGCTVYVGLAALDRPETVVLPREREQTQ